MKILLVSPRSEDDFYINLFKEIPYIQHKSKKQAGAYVAPHAAATIAALTPAEHEIRIHDEHVNGRIEGALRSGQYDIIGISMLTNQFKRTIDIAKYCKCLQPAPLVVVGGAGTSMLKKGLMETVDVVFCGEAEDTWPRFLKECAAGEHQQVYQQISKPPPEKFPIPRWDLIKDDIEAYGSGAVQTTRGCPYDCVYCDVIYIYGRRIRNKPISQILEEIRILENIGCKFVLVTDDNFGCNRKHSKALLKKLIPLNNSFKTPLRFITQTDITIAEDDEFLELMADAGFVEVLIGIESINKDSLKDFNKIHNTRKDILWAVKKVQSYGIIVLGSMIIGADSDDTSSFEKTVDFIKTANITDHVCHPLMAPRGTKLWYQLKRQGRLVERPNDEWGDRMDIMTNIVPKKMTRTELLRGLAEYWEIVMHPLHYSKRVVGFIKGVKRKPRVKRNLWPMMWKARKMMFRSLWYYLFEVSRDHRKAFFTVLKTTRRHAPYLLPQIMFLHTCYMINSKRAAIAARLARERSDWEERYPGDVKLEAPTLPIPPKVIEASHKIITTCYLRVREKILEPEALYTAVLEALMDYINRFGEAFEEFDDFQIHYLHESCDRILAKQAVCEPVDAAKMAPLRPPAGFVREIMDALDHSIGLRKWMVAAKG